MAPLIIPPSNTRESKKAEPKQEEDLIPLPTHINVTDGTLIPQKGERGALSAWNISFFGALAILAVLVIFFPDPYVKILSFVPDGLMVTFGVTIAAIFFALFIGLIAGLGRISQVTIINRIATVYVEVIRGIPLLVQLFYIYYALGNWVKLSGPAAAILAMSICYGAYMAEIFRAGIQSIPKGQMEAALALGLSRAQAMQKVILPQTIKVILPPIGNEFIALLKDSSLVSILAVADLLRRGREFASTSFRYFESYTVIALIYLVMTLFFSRLVAIMEERLRHRGTLH
ncbi:amino acid ABC transporter permease [Gracilinema caldarium]|uniref:amino acid ABC transporter permease n=1 Tax=Gracilinema caldarium TaxID=215591 RepID=UPI0026E92F98|nr:amino acid ABC transporter permease [Gracilinema caldarium]